MKKIFYEKRGRRYYPVSEYDSELTDALPKGAHLVLVYPGGQSTRYNVDPVVAPMLAASRTVEDAMSAAVIKASEIRLQRSDRERKLTESQKLAWENLVREFGDSAKQLEWASAREIAEAGVAALVKETEQLMSNPSVQAAYEDFQLICKLTQEKEQS